MIVICVLDCGECDIYKDTNNPEIVKKIANWFKEKRNEDFRIEDIHCFGCRGYRKMHWSADYWILECCLDKKGLAFCYECYEFPCEKLIESSKQNSDYAEDFNRLKEMRK